MANKVPPPQSDGYSSDGVRGGGGGGGGAGQIGTLPADDIESCGEQKNPLVFHLYANGLVTQINP